MVSAKHIRVSGIVQGVGFRPFVYEAATKNELAGWVRNTSNGVEIEIHGATPAIEDFISRLRNSPPPLAEITGMIIEDIPYDAASLHFLITESFQDANAYVPIAPDIAICPDCLRELFDPVDRRYRYPFINCTNCGPRFTIVCDIPYDRPKTTMANFPMCPECFQEYLNPLDRRFHAQPIACPVCGPHLALMVNGKIVEFNDEAIKLSRKLIMDGRILAVKGIGGYHLACNPYNPDAVALLRLRKLRSMKPFALMAWNLEVISRHAEVTPGATDLLNSREKPVVLVDRKPGSRLDHAVAPGQRTFGFMLPYTPLHHLLLEPGRGFPDTLIMTSANLSEEPIAYLDLDCEKRLPGLADAILTHDRDIHIRTDDSVFQCYFETPYPVRRSRGYTPSPIRLPAQVDQILATGPELKNSFCLSREDHVFISHHIGDLQNIETYQAFVEAIDHYERIFRINPRILACDLHPDYLSTRYAHQRAEQLGLPLVQVQHHHAHLASCMAEHRVDPADRIIGLCFDGTGYGADGTIWGGEVLFGNYSSYDRLFHLEPFLLPGSEVAIRHPSRIALALLWQYNLDWDDRLPPVRCFSQEERKFFKTQLEKKLNSPVTTSMGRLFDAISSLIGVCQISSYEAQPAMELQSIAETSEQGYYPIPINDTRLELGPLLEGVILDIMEGATPPIISARFHNSIAHMALEVSRNASQRFGGNKIALTGGVWQNMYLLEKTHKLLSDSGFLPLVHRLVPTNDGGVSLGQLMVAAIGAKEM